jgi:mannose-6-phosphate isomerase-like protein (cupin superfamily)
MTEGGWFLPRRVDKPWGYELIWAHTERYVGKILHIEAGEALSLQYHRVKDETLYVLAGALRMELSDSDDGERRVLDLVPGQAIRLVPGTRHRLIALEPCDVLEASTAELDDVVRLVDRYGRADPAGTR